MATQDLFETVVRKLNAKGVVFSDIERKTGVSRKTLMRVAKQQNDSRHGTLKRINEYFKGAA